MAARKASRSDEALKHAVIAAALPHVAAYGFTGKLLKVAAAEAGVAHGDIARLFPDGALSLIEAYSAEVDAEMEQRLAKLKLKSMPVRKRIKTAVETRLDILRPHKDAVRRAVVHLSLPPNVALGAKLIYRTVDGMWRAAGDVSTDFNFYTKRGIVAGVYTATMMRWFTDASADEALTEAFLAARIENAMQVEKLKARVRERAKEGFDRLSEVLRPRS